MKKTLLFTTCLLVIVLLCSCNPAPRVTVQIIPPATSASPTAAESGEDVVLAKEQQDKIDALLTGALSMCESEIDATFFQDASTLTTDKLLGFVYVMLNDEYTRVGGELKDSGTVSSTEVHNIIRSAFGIEYKPHTGDCYGEIFQYNGNDFIFEGSDGLLTYAYPYSITRKPSGTLEIKFNIFYDVIPEVNYFCMGEAVLQEDTESIFGYRLVSLVKADDADISFTSAEASSYLSADGSRTYSAENVIDGNDNTAWAANGGKGEWIKLSFYKPQNITGLMLHFGDWSNNDVFESHDLPLSCQLEFSDGTSITDDNCEPEEIGDDNCVTFGKVINTSYVKITITSILERTEDGGSEVYVSEIKPF